jgi:predicted DNA-binding transcriptional regulator AlpA
VWSRASGAVRKQRAEQADREGPLALIRPTTVAQLLGVGRDEVQTLRRRGELPAPAVRLTRHRVAWQHADIEAAAAGRAVPARPDCWPGCRSADPVARRRSPAYGGLSLLEMLSAGRWEELRRSVRPSRWTSRPTRSRACREDAATASWRRQDGAHRRRGGAHRASWPVMRSAGIRTRRRFTPPSA